jgi:hypothetical protein
LDKQIDCDAYIVRLDNSSIAGVLLPETDPQYQLAKIAGIYFPELKAETDIYLAMFNHRKKSCLDLTTEIREALGKQDHDAQTKAYEQFHQVTASNQRELRIAGSRLNSAAAKLLRHIMGA